MVRTWIFFIALLLPVEVGGEIRYVDSPDTLIKGSWYQDHDGGLRIVNESQSFDLNFDGTDDIQLGHGFVRQSLFIEPDAVPYVETALDGLHQIHGLLLESRSLAIEAANTDANDADARAGLQAVMDNQIDAIDRVARNTQYRGRVLLDGSAGRQAWADNSRVHVLRATEDTSVGTYDLNVLSAAERAYVRTSVIQERGLAREEVLTINGTAIRLPEGLTRVDVANRINEAYPDTGVMAQSSPSGTTVYTLRGGSRAEVQVTASVASSDDSSGFGFVESVDIGSDAIVELGGQRIVGSGERVTIRQGELNGLSFLLGFQDLISTVSGAQGRITVEDHSLEFDGSAATRVTLPDVRAASLGTGLPGVRLQSLHDAHVYSQSKVNATISVIDAAIDEIRSQVTRLNGLLNLVGPQMRHSVFGLDGAQLLMKGDQLRLLGPGETVGPDDHYWMGTNEVAHPEVGYLGIQIEVGPHVHYGWVGVATDSAGGFVLTDWAYETDPERPIAAGAVAAPTIQGDVNGDGLVGAIDLAVIQANLFSTTDRGATGGDLNRDRFVDVRDFNLWNDAQASQPLTVPEPRAFLGWLSLFLLSRKRKRSLPPFWQPGQV